MKKVKYIFSILMTIAALGGIFKGDNLAGLFLLILGVILLPPISDQLKQNIKLWQNKTVRYIAYFGLILLTGATTDKKNIKTKGNRTKSEQIAAKGKVTSGNSNASNATTENVTSSSSQASNVDFRISAYKLYKDYDDNEIAADNKYKDKMLAVTGVIKEIQKDFLGNPIITLVATGYLFGVTCEFDEENNEVLSKLSKNRKITIIGECSGLSVGSVHLTDCILK